MNGPDFAVIVPTRNRASNLTTTIDSLASQRFAAHRYEILVVDNGSTDETRTVVDQMILAYSKRRIRQVTETIPGLLAGRHRGFKETSAPFLVFVDDDIRADLDWLAAIDVAFTEADVHLVGGPNLPEYETSPPPWVETFKHPGQESGWWCGALSLLDFGSKRQIIDPLFVFGLNFAIRRDTLIRVGGFHPDGVPWELRRFRGDGESAVSSAIKKLGLTALYEPGALVHHLIPATRVTEGYFERRSFLQGISDSYTAIRSLKFGNSPKQESGLFGRLGRFLWRPGQRIKRFLRSIKRTQSQSVQLKVRNAYQDGFQYHQQEVACDPELLAWVLRSNYWDFSFPNNVSGYSSEPQSGVVGR